MLLSTLIFTASAEAATNTKTENFESQTVGEAYNRGDNFQWTITDGNGTNSTIVSDESNQYAKVKVVAYKDTWVYPGGFAVRSFQMTFDMMMPDHATSGYYGFYLHANKFDNNDIADNDAEALVITNPESASQKTYVKSTSSSEQKNNIYNVNEWYTVEFARDGKKLEVRIWKKGEERPEEATVSGTLTDACNGDVCPAIQLINRDKDSSENSIDHYIYFDNFMATSPYSMGEDETPTYTVEDETPSTEWDDLTVAATNFGTGYETNFQNGFTIGAQYGTGVKMKQGVKQEEGNQYYSVDLESHTDGTGTYGSTLTAKNFTSNQYTLSGDIRLETANASGYYGVYFTPTAANSDGLMMLSRGGSVDVAWGSGNQVKDAATRGDSWYSFEYTRIGSAVSFTLWEKGKAKPVTATMIQTLTTTASAPTIRFVSDTSNVTVSIDNLKLSNLPEVACVAAQTTGKLDEEDNTYAVRFISTLNSLDYAAAGFEITAVAADGTTKTFNASTDTVFGSILANAEVGIADAYTAAQLGGKYLVAVSITDIPSGLGNVTFTVKPFCEKNGTRTYGAEKTLTVNDGAAVNS